MFHHETVLKQEAIDGLNIREEGVYVDCTMGGAGHSVEIASKLSGQGLLIAIDQDDVALAHGKQLLKPWEQHVRIKKSNFRHLKSLIESDETLQKTGRRKVDGILFDLGVSSPQLDEAERGFSYNSDAELDMRMDRSQPFTAKQLVNEWSEAEIAKILFEYGEEKFSRKIARNIVRARSQRPIETTGELSELIKEAIPAAARRTGPHPSKRSFQAIRIAVNDELGAFKDALRQAIDCLSVGGRISVITFHSLEDRICKQIIQEKMQGCTCPPDFPVCNCGREHTMRWISKKPILPSEKELQDNPRARSAKLRVAEKLKED